MRLTLCAVGRMKSGPEADLFQDYASRVRASGPPIGLTAFEIREVDPARHEKPAGRKKLEAGALLAAAPDKAILIALDERGRAYRSVQFADKIARWRDEGARDACFVIGGPDGHGPDIADAAHATIAFGPATWPHMMVRIMLCEQIYRAIAILSGRPYHRA